MNGSFVVLGLLLPLVVLWIATSMATALAFYALDNRGPDTGDRLGPEIWLALASSGAAVGGFLAVALILPGAANGHGGMVALTILYAAPGMVLGAAFASVVAAAVLQLVRPGTR